ncbi:MAG: hypothetical protein FJ098_12940 [Deltaproteobacteria bacterium]|nr:hypothetical protein [Deltaproteobacteria bacterium]
MRTSPALLVATMGILAAGTVQAQGIVITSSKDIPTLSQFDPYATGTPVPISPEPEPLPRTAVILVGTGDHDLQFSTRNGNYVSFVDPFKASLVEAVRGWLTRIGFQVVERPEVPHAYHARIKLAAHTVHDVKVGHLMTGSVRLDIATADGRTLQQLTVNLDRFNWRRQPPDNIAQALVTLASMSEPLLADLASSAPAEPARKNTGPVLLAIFDPKDTAGVLDASSSAQLVTYLAARLTQTGAYSVVPQDQVRERLSEKKKESYGVCYDQSCQIELGRALAAEKSLATELLKVGSKCAITVTLYDLRTEASEKATTVRTDCSDDGLLDAMDRIAEQLVAPTAE